MEEVFEQLTILIQSEFDNMLEYPWNCVGKACGTTLWDDKSAIAARGAKNKLWVKSSMRLQQKKHLQKVKGY